VKCLENRCYASSLNDFIINLKKTTMKKNYLVLAIILLAGITGAFAQADVKETVAILKANLLESREKIKKYEWIETTTTFYKGAQKSKKQNQCYYGVDGKLTKVETGGGTSPAKSKPGIRGKVMENKKEDMKEYMESAVAKIHTYLPPDANKIQQIYDAGKVAIHVLEPEKKYKLDFPDYNQAGDMMSVTIDKEKKMILAITVSTYIDDPNDKVIFEIKYNSLPDRTQYPGTTSLDAQAKNVKIVIVNSGHKKGAS
jgi:hypothetical protein